MPSMQKRWARRRQGRSRILALAGRFGSASAPLALRHFRHSGGTRHGAFRALAR